MKTKDQVLSHFTEGDSEDRESGVWLYKNRILAAMEEYAAQFQQPKSISNSEIEFLFSSDYGKFEKAFRSIVEGHPTQEETHFVDDFLHRWKQVQSSPALLPFDLQRALAGDKVIDDNGRISKEVTILGKGTNIEVFLVLFEDGLIKAFTSHRYTNLFMAPRTVTKWVNFFSDGTAHYYDNQETAMIVAAVKKNVLRTTKITWEE